jgi:D-serine dehydratase
VAQEGWNVLREDLEFPVLVLKDAAMRNNLRLMARACDAAGILHAPHAKTHMSPAVIRLQLAAGAWGITVATTAQARACRAFGADRILLANQLVDRRGLEWVAREMARHPQFELYCLADSVSGVQRMQHQLSSADAPRPVNVLIEIGFEGGRAGVRTIDDLTAVARAADASPNLNLAGVEAYEGIINCPTQDRTVAEVDAFVRHVLDGLAALGREAAISAPSQWLLSIGASAFFDRVLMAVSQRPDLPPAQVVIRAGSYIAHDSLYYERISPLAGRSNKTDRLKPALEIWASVLSRPEPSMAILGFGRRDVPCYEELPVVTAVKDGTGLREPGEGWHLLDLNDHHAYLRLSQPCDLRVGDLVACGMCQPAAAFEKWPLIAVVDTDYDVIDVIRTYF